MKLKILIIFLIGWIANGKSENVSGIIETLSGPVQGLILKTVLNKMEYTSFRGIPYAQSPVNELRFRPPVPKSPWKETLKAFADKDRCIQMYQKSVVGSEDCLYLNVYVPGTINNVISKTKLKSVMVWIHGGGFTTGHASSSYYGPDFLIEKDVILVSMNYRLGPFGFLNIHHDKATGNMGLKDQNLALKWVKNNIHKFGGDPNTITIFGQSAGGVSVDFHKLSSMSEGLFNKSISMSGSPLCKYWAFQSFEEAEVQALILGLLLGIISKSRDEFLKMLLKKPAKEIIEKANELVGLPFRPTLEKTDVAVNETKFMTNCSPKVYESGNYNKGSHMMGFTSLEILEYTKALDDLINVHVEASRSFKNNDLISVIPIMPEILEWKFKKTASIKTDALKVFLQYISDMYFVTGIDKKQQLLQLHNGDPIYYYRFTYVSPFSAHKAEGIQYLDGVAHEDELPYLFYRPFLNIPLNDSSVTYIRETLLLLWTNFAKYGNPTPLGNKDSKLKVTWPNSGVKGNHLEIGETLTVKDRPVNDLVNLYQKLGFGDSKIYNDCEQGRLADLVNGLTDFPAEIIDSSKKVKNLFDVLYKKTKGNIEGILSNLEVKYNTAKSTVENNLEIVKNAVKNSVDKDKNRINQVYTDTLQLLKNKVTESYKVNAGKLNGILNPVNGLFNTVSEVFKKE